MMMRFTIQEIIIRVGVEPTAIQRFIENEWVHPVDLEHSVFDEEDLARIQLIHDLQNTMGVNDDAVPVILQLVDQLNLIHRTARK